MKTNSNNLTQTIIIIENGIKRSATDIENNLLNLCMNIGLQLGGDVLNVGTSYIECESINSEDLKNAINQIMNYFDTHRNNN